MDSILLPSLGDNIIRTKDVDFPLDKHGLAHMLFKASNEHKSNIAQINADTGSYDTYEDLVHRSIRVALEMKKRGIKPDDIVSFCSESHRDVFVAYFATLLVGAVVSALDPSISKSDMKHLLAQVPPKMMFITPKCEEVIEEVLKSINATPAIVIFGQSDRNIQFDNILVKRDADAEAAFTPYKVENVFKTAIVFFSSGTTGLPKGICLNHYSLMCNALEMALAAKTFPIYLAFASVYWLSAIQVFTTTVVAGTTRLLVPGFDVETFWQYVHKYKVTAVMLSPYLATRVLKSCIPKGLDISCLGAMMIGGGKVTVELLESLSLKLPNTTVIQGYGITEIGGNIVKLDLTVPKTKAAACGRPKGHIWYKVVDPDTEEILGPNKPGELRLKTKLAMNGYYNLDSSSAWDSDGWLRTGDICYYDEDYYFYFVQRLKAVIKYRGIHVQSTILEQILLQHPAVDQAVVIGLPHPEDEELPMAVVILTDDAKSTSPEELRKYVDEKVDDPKKLRGGVRIVDEFPFTPSGKINSREIKRRICEEMNITL